MNKASAQTWQTLDKCQVSSTCCDPLCPAAGSCFSTGLHSAGGLPLMDSGSSTSAESWRPCGLAPRNPSGDQRVMNCQEEGARSKGKGAWALHNEDGSQSLDDPARPLKTKLGKRGPPKYSFLIGVPLSRTEMYQWSHSPVKAVLAV